MAYFTIDTENRVQAHSAKPNRAGPPGSVTFVSEAHFANLSAEWPGSRLVQIWNNLSGVKPVRKFTNREIAVHRIWAALQDASHVPGETGQTTKTAAIIALLKQPTGATLKELMAATGWQSHSVRGFLSAQLSKRKGLRIRSFKRNGERVYRIQSQVKDQPRRNSK